MEAIVAKHRQFTMVLVINSTSSKGSSFLPIAICITIAGLIGYMFVSLPMIQGSKTDIQAERLRNEYNAMFKGMRKGPQMTELNVQNGITGEQLTYMGTEREVILARALDVENQANARFNDLKLKHQKQEMAYSLEAEVRTLAEIKHTNGKMGDLLGSTRAGQASQLSVQNQAVQITQKHIKDNANMIEQVSRARLDGQIEATNAQNKSEAAQQEVMRSLRRQELDDLKQSAERELK